MIKTIICQINLILIPLSLYSTQSVTLGTHFVLEIEAVLPA